MMITGKTSSGFEFEYDSLRLDDVRYVDVLAVAIDEKESDLERIKATSRLTKMLLGEELKERLYDFIAERNAGRVPAAELNTHLAEIMDAAKRGAEKN